MAERTITDRDCGSFRQDLEHLLRTVDAFLGSAAGAAIVAAAIESRDDPDHEDAIRRYWNARLAALEPMFARARQRGELTARSWTG